MIGVLKSLLYDMKYNNKIERKKKDKWIMFCGYRIEKKIPFLKVGTLGVVIT